MELLLALLLLVLVLILVTGMFYCILLLITILMLIQRNSLKAFGHEANMNAEPSAMPHAASKKLCQRSWKFYSTTMPCFDWIPGHEQTAIPLEISRCLLGTASFTA